MENKCIYCESIIIRYDCNSYPEIYYKCNSRDCPVMFVWFYNDTDYLYECIEFTYESDIYIMHIPQVKIKLKTDRYDGLIEVEEITKEIFIKKLDNIILLG